MIAYTENSKESIHQLSDLEVNEYKFDLKINFTPL